MQLLFCAFISTDQWKIGVTKGCLLNFTAAQSLTLSVFTAHMKTSFLCNVSANLQNNTGK